MVISELIKKLQEMMAEHGDLEVQMTVPEGPYTRCEGEPDIFGLGYCDDAGEYVSPERYAGLLSETEEDGRDLSHISGPVLCIGAVAY